MLHRIHQRIGVRTIVNKCYENSSITACYSSRVVAPIAQCLPSIIAVQQQNSKMKADTVEVAYEEEDRVGRTAHDWESYKKKDFFDDGTISFFWQAHTLTALFFLTCGLVYVALVEDVILDSQYNMKRGIIACILVFILLGVTQTPDGPFMRPHPAVWRFVFCVSVVYELFLIFIIFQTVDDARQLLRHIDTKLGIPLEEKAYGGNCRIYDYENPVDPFHNVWDKFDVFVPTHFVGWWLKTLILRDWWLCTVVSIMFEVLEYTLEHQLPNFSECWWDHWILDALVCNGLGIFLGLKTLRYFSMKPYHWRGMWSIPTYRGKLKRIIAQFGPHSWIDFDWKPTTSLYRWLATLGVIALFLLAELNTFYLKFILWVPPAHYLNLVRVIILTLAGAVGLRETFQYLDDPECKTFGRQSWVLAAIVITEFLIIAKFAWFTITKPLPKPIAGLWLLGVIILSVWTIWNFFVKKEADSRESSVAKVIPNAYTPVVERSSVQTSGEMRQRLKK